MFLNLITILFLCSFVFGPTGFAGEVKVKNELSDAEYFKQFYDVFERVNRDYVQEPEKQKMTDAAINGMLNSLDPHSSYITDDDLRDFLINTQGEFGGIGVEVMYDHGAIKVISPIDDLPAYKAGIKAGDYIVGVNDELVSTLGFNKAVHEMRGEPGTKVKLLVIQEGEPKPKEIELTREVVTIKAVKANLEKNNVAYVRITTFNENTISELKKAIRNLNKEGIKGIILDLRNNPGGLLDQAVAVSEYFINSGVIVTIKGRTPNSNSVITSSPAKEKSPNVPMVVLINSGSASASEIVAGAMQDHRRALILGTKSFGKGSVQTLTQISPRAAVKLTTAKYYTPNNRSIQAEGIEPDIIIEVAKVEYPENNGIEKRFSESSLRNYLKNDKEKVDNKKVDPKDNKKGDPKANQKVDLKANTNGTKQANETVKNKSTVKESVPKSTTEAERQLSDLYKKDYQFARAYDLIVGLILVNDNEKSRKNNKNP